ncbi:MAG: entericidin A/B family lipoprotein [Candidatus Competibacterales bacterium]|nr:entericidin A/B family lipoprotein [Candidatus Competibacterales bacterium]
MTHRSLVFFSPILLVLALLGGCNTTEGLGEDVEALGETLEEEAEQTQGY